MVFGILNKGKNKCKNAGQPPFPTSLEKKRLKKECRSTNLLRKEIGISVPQIQPQ
jgi:hypothetical protein